MVLAGGSSGWWRVILGGGNVLRRERRRMRSRTITLTWLGCDGLGERTARIRVFFLVLLGVVGQDLT